MRTQAKDRQLTSDQHLRYDLLVCTSFEIRTGMNGVFPGPARWGEKRIQPIRIGPLIRIRHNLATGRLLSFGGVYHPPFNL
jgi:hypothetical protein